MRESFLGTTGRPPLDTPTPLLAVRGVPVFFCSALPRRTCCCTTVCSVCLCRQSFRALSAPYRLRGGYSTYSAFVFMNSSMCLLCRQCCLAGPCAHPKPLPGIKCFMFSALACRSGGTAALCYALCCSICSDHVQGR